MQSDKWVRNLKQGQLCRTGGNFRDFLGRLSGSGINSIVKSRVATVGDTYFLVICTFFQATALRLGFCLPVGCPDAADDGQEHRISGNFAAHEGT